MANVYLMKCCHPRHVDSVKINIHAGSSQHAHDGISVTLFDVVFKDNLIREPDPSLTRVQPGKYTGSPRHCSPDSWAWPRLTITWVFALIKNEYGLSRFALISLSVNGWSSLAVLELQGITAPQYLTRYWGCCDMRWVQYWHWHWPRTRTCAVAVATLNHYHWRIQTSVKSIRNKLNVHFQRIYNALKRCNFILDETPLQLVVAYLVWRHNLFLNNVFVWQYNWRGFSYFLLL